MLRKGDIQGFASEAAKLMSGGKSWTTIRRASEKKNKEAFDKVWPKLNQKFKGLPAEAKEYKAARRKQFVKETTATDIKALKKLKRGDEDLESQILSSKACAESRAKLIVNNEVHKATEHAGRIRAVQNGYTKKTWENSGKACERCKKMKGETVAIGKPYSNGTLDADLHSGCQCYSSYS